MNNQYVNPLDAEKAQAPYDGRCSKCKEKTQVKLIRCDHNLLAKPYCAVCNPENKTGMNQ